MRCEIKVLIDASSASAYKGDASSTSAYKIDASSASAYKDDVYHYFN
jgi:hypothetical protein